MTRAAFSLPILIFVALAVTGCERIKDSLPWQRFSVASTSMEPTLLKGTHVTGQAIKAANLKRGDMVIVRRGDEKWLSRLAGKPGDRIGMVEGTVMLNGKPIQQRAIGSWTITDGLGAPDATVLSERFPGERRAHRVLDDGVTPGDNFEEIALGPDKYFLLGDNRDHAADSRIDNEFFGLGVVNGDSIERRVTPPED